MFTDRFSVLAISAAAVGLAVCVLIIFRQRKRQAANPTCGACGVPVRGLPTFNWRCGRDLRTVGIRATPPPGIATGLGVVLATMLAGLICLGPPGAAVGLLGALIWGLSVANKHWERGELSCGKCGYSVRGTTTFFCPECGSDLRVVGIARPARRRMMVAAILFWVVLSTGLVLTSFWQWYRAVGQAVGPVAVRQSQAAVAPTSHPVSPPTTQPHRP